MNHFSREIKVKRFIFGTHAPLTVVMKIYRLKNMRFISVYYQVPTANKIIHIHNEYKVYVF